MKTWVYFNEDDDDYHKDLASCGYKVRLCFDTMCEHGFYAESLNDGEREWKRIP